MRKPFIHMMPIPGCENDNANFFSEREMSLKCENIKQVVDNTKKLIENKNLQKQIIENQEKYISGDACEKIADVVIKELDRGSIREKRAI